ncbi:nucleoside-diphosphate sugar epimerase/dehydratase [Holdemania filiformis]|uniref:nucleoside-diphosphate sugar epimerase/dehydratase n=1 Tax=Holdemania filiformis TaxID=61171 RepID=UPI00248EF5CC|nr:nucleoside-diphosphate sugar epimerase/dehydratase [Holdemania filiformis]
MKQLEKKRIEHWQVISLYLLIYDIIAVNLAYLLALWFRFDCRFSLIPEVYLKAWIQFAPFYTVLCLAVFTVLKLYRSLWRFAGYSELLRVTVATVLTGFLHYVGITLFFEAMPISYILFGMIIQFCLIIGIRFSYRFVLLERSRREKSEKKNQGKNILLIGAGDAGRLILRDVQRTEFDVGKVQCIIDDNPNKWGRYIENISIVGGRDEIMASVEKYQIQQILIAIPSAKAEEKRDILNICKETGCELKILPGIYQLVNGDVMLSKMKEVAVEDLLGREPIQVNLDEIFEHLKGKTILVTGGGGSIGSELCRQIAGHHPKQLILFEIYENNAYDIEQELKRKYPELNLVVLIGSVRDSRRIDWVFETYKPDIVYHAAAHKHVPLMEGSPNEAIKNNVIGTYKTAYAALKSGCQRFVLISTDKAVNPTNIMGASKRLCEMVIQSMNQISQTGQVDLLPQLWSHSWNPIEEVRANPVKTEFVAVRFGNVLGSNGSVIPLFKKQIADGGPVTVTHPDIIRYFMTIPEAVSLVLQAGTYARGGEIFVLDMGDPVKIDTLARNLIKLSGYKPDIDIKIEYTGLRPGEKLYEEKLMAEEGLQTTPNRLIHIAKPIPFDVEAFMKQVEILAEASYTNSQNIKQLVSEIVPTYHPGNKKQDESERKKIQKLSQKEQENPEPVFTIGGVD